MDSPMSHRPFLILAICFACAVAGQARAQDAPSFQSSGSAAARVAGQARVQDAPSGESLFEAALPPGSVYVVPIEGTIDNVLARYVSRAVADAERANASLLIFHVDTFGGLVDAADAIRKTILNAGPPTVAFIDKNAASAGALIAYAHDRIVMVPGASIGAATVVQGGTGEVAPDKYQSYMRGLMRATAEANGRDPRIAEAMVDQSLEVEGISPAGSVLTLSSEEAHRFGVADAVLSSVDLVIEQAGLDGARRVVHAASGVERLLRFLSSPILQSLLMLMMMGGLYFELQTPGVGFPGAIAAVGAAVFFAPHYMMGLVQSWEIVLFGIGVLLLLLEIFVIPGFGAAGISGLVLVVFSLVAALIGNVGLSFPSIESFTSAVITMAVTLALFFVLIFSLGRHLPRSERFNRLVLAPELSSGSGYVSADTHDEFLGRTGLTLTTLRPSGMAEIDGERVDVVASGEFIPQGVLIEVVLVRGSRVVVRRARGASAGKTASA